jgi:hypothetical protein
MRERARDQPNALADVVYWQICCKSRLLAMDRSAISLRTTGFDALALTLSTQLERYARHRS